MESQQDKKLVEKHRQTNKALRNQLLALNDQIDRLLIKKSNSVGLKPLPIVFKRLTDAKVIQVEVQNMRKRLQLLQKDKQKYQSKASVDYNKRTRDLEQELQSRNNDRDQVRRLLKLQQRQERKNLMKHSPQKGEDLSVLDKIEKLNQQIARYHKIQKELKKLVSEQEESEHRKNNYIVRREQENKQLHRSSPRKDELRLQTIRPIVHSSIPERQWKELKKQFLQLKESKQQEQMYLYEQNDKLRRDIRTVQSKLKQKKGRIQYVKNSAVKRARNYSTLQHSREQPKFRYRDKNNSIRLSRNTLQL